MVIAARQSVARRFWQALPFGSEAAHVGVNFGAPPPYVVTAVLVACLQDQDGARLDEGQAWDWSVASRLQGLLAVVRATRPADLDVNALCHGCHEPLSFSLPLADFVQPAVHGPVSCQPKDRVAFGVRLPTGRDQQRWLANGEEDPAAMARDLVLAEAVLAEWSDDHLLVMEQQLEQADPYTALNLQSVCPYCEADVSEPLNLENVLLHRLQSVLTERLRDVHRLARAYHWSEADILALSSQRRDFYLACISREGVL